MHDTERHRIQTFTFRFTNRRQFYSCRFALNSGNTLESLLMIFILIDPDPSMIPPFCKWLQCMSGPSGATCHGLCKALYELNHHTAQPMTF
ncbi:hypothetical protein K503DRAFT_593592 [Rhizopogon vinicolor AM-OR11-026]|uniref:Uncharacterized protein n=1 Tax=Rhizopogon vinicolor AM-OR11-026 TaxID=1314800 RepID=A0A1B7N6X3_9AGAM|nr:hypothetical protein K503DRAFT_593592 [Rhizopogon vinicolor AM-OR11-026]